MNAYQRDFMDQSSISIPAVVFMPEARQLSRMHGDVQQAMKPTFLVDSGHIVLDKDRNPM